LCHIISTTTSLNKLKGQILITCAQGALNVTDLYSAREKDEPKTDGVISITKLRNVPLLLLEVWASCVSDDVGLEDFGVAVWVDIA